ncbi:MAG: AAA family ATPase, partial [Bacilli bacterium]|nr:AAA family ATPase [Bacilli bacterium]
LKIDIDYEDFTKYSINENIIIEEDMYYLKEMYQDIEYITYRIKRLTKQDIKNYKIDNYIESLENSLDIKYSNSQKQAIINSINNNISIITGGPGTGKTTIVNAICEIYAMINKYNKTNMEDKVALLAPTGRASKRLKESTNLKASTIHRFLKWNKEDDKFQINANNISEVDLVIIDEASMIDIPLFASLLKGLSYKTNIIIVGDYNQLPSVGPGTLLKDLIDSNIINTTYLDLLYRQDVNSYINKLAIEVKNNKLSNFKEKKDDYLFIETNNILPYLKQVCTKLIEKYNDREIQVMAPIYSSMNGIDNLNKELQNIFNPSDINKKELKVGDVIYRENDKILQLVNMPEENIYNGDIGTIKYIICKENSKSGSDEIHVMFDNNLVKYTTKDFVKIKHGYCISIHKSQGSEFKIVILPICNSYKRMLYRKLIYTAITRAKNKLIVIGDSDSFIYSVSNNNEYIRNSKLKEKLINMYN